MGFYYRDLTSRPPKKIIPRLKKLETAMYNSLLRSDDHYLRKNWLVGRSSKKAYILRGTKKEDPLSGDIKVVLETIVVELGAEVYDPLEEG